MALNLRYLGAWANRTESAIEIQTNRLTKRVANEVLKSLVTTTPVDTSKALSNWRVSVKGRRTTKSISAHIKGFAGSTRAASAAIAISTGSGVIASREAKKTIHITNNLPYIEGLDNGTISLQPSGFVAKALIIGNAEARAFKWILK